jgi:hypothetical protein
MTAHETISNVLLTGSTTGSWSASDLAQTTKLPRPVVARALAELAVEGRAVRHLVADQGHLVVRWSARR